MKDCFLILNRGSGPGTVYPLLDGVSIGRDADNDIVLADSKVSRRHARISLQEEAWVLEDLGTANGTILNGLPVASKTLTSGDIFKIGEFTFRYIEKDIPEARDQFFETITIL
jgi:pSer/pThr/pTyr-binding forkhead associated (FHA) protein